MKNYFALLVIVIPLVVVLAVLLTGCTDENGARKALGDANLTPVAVGGYSFFGCDEKDTFATKFTAINAQGQTVSGVVCSGFLKGKTIRFD